MIIGKHFRCGEFLYYILYELRKEGIIAEVNFFTEHHGKNSRDQMFSIVANYIKRESLTKQLIESSDIVEAIQTRQEASNKIRSQKSNIF